MNKNFREDYQWLVNKFPEGLVGAKNGVPISIDRNEMIVLVFAHGRNAHAVSLFLREASYARKTLVVNNDGQLTEEVEKTRNGIRVNVLPEFDLTDHEPVFTSSNEQIFSLAMETLRNRFPNN